MSGLPQLENIYIYIYREFKNILSSVVNVSIYYLHQY